MVMYISLLKMKTCKVITRDVFVRGLAQLGEPGGMPLEILTHLFIIILYMVCMVYGMCTHKCDVCNRVQLLFTAKVKKDWMLLCAIYTPLRG